MKNRRKIDILFCKDLAKKREGLCLSKEYVRNSDKLRWKCGKCANVWEATLNSVLYKGSWCVYCSGKKLDIYKCSLFAKRLGGYCLSEECKGSHDKLKWKCGSCFNTWSATPNNVRQGKWCPLCGKKKQKQTCLRKYGAESALDRKSKVRKKIDRTLMEKYGTKYISQVPEIAKKAAKSNNASYVLTHWFSSEKIVCIGSWERKVVEHLNKNKIDYLWQVQTFRMSNKRTYTPDLYLPEEDLWIEIKGYLRKDAKEKWDWFHKSYPNSELWDKKKLKEMEIL